MLSLRRKLCPLLLVSVLLGLAACGRPGSGRDVSPQAAPTTTASVRPTPDVICEDGGTRILTREYVTEPGQGGGVEVVVKTDDSLYSVRNTSNSRKRSMGRVVPEESQWRVWFNLPPGRAYVGCEPEGGLPSHEIEWGEILIHPAPASAPTPTSSP